ncbi:MAG: GDP-mannose dehydrogenase [Caldithrix sp. RBG_13_44_9]|nr:MAG: GDP-mannose dehydrogenase [Caldithrix sp. RBG_13_44_9]
MRINLYGLGYVGCVSAACLAKEGHDVLGIDIDAIKVNLINEGKSPVIERDLNKLIQAAIQAKKLKATIDEIRPAKLSIICVGTPSNDNGSLNLLYLKNVARQIAENIRESREFHTICVRSTVLPGTIENEIIPIIEKVSRKKVKKDFGICMNPEFLREGSSVEDYYHPPFSIIGEMDKKSGNLVASLYKHIKAPLIRTEIKIAEMVKYACNSFHALKICFANEIGNISKKLGMDSYEVMNIFCEDKKLNISNSYLRPGFAFGGSCLPKDLRALLYQAKENDLEIPVINSILSSNSKQIEYAFSIIKKIGKNRVGLLGLSFKPGTDDLRESPLVELAEKLIGKGYILSIYDREVSLAKIFGSNKKYIESVIPHLSSLMKNSIDEIFKESEIVVIANNYPGLKRNISKLSKDRVVIDLARIFTPKEAKHYTYEGISW